MKLSWEKYIDGLTELERPIAGVYARIVSERVPREVLEVGSGWGIFAFAALHMSPRMKLTSIDKIQIEGRQDFNQRTAGYESRIERMVGDSWLVLPEMVKEEKRFDMVFVDGGHDYETCLSDLQNGWKLLRPGGTLLIDDVFHKNNYKFDESEEAHDYGVGQALWDWSKEILPRAYEIKFYCIGSGGLAVIEKLV